MDTIKVSFTTLFIVFSAQFADSQQKSTTPVFFTDDTAAAAALGEAVHKRRRALKLTLDAVSDMTGITKKTRIALEKGRDVRVSTVLTVCGLLGCTLNITAPEPEKEDVIVWF